MQPPKFDIVIAHYRANPELEATFLECLKSIRAFSAFENYRLTIIFNGDESFTAPVLEELAQHQHQFVRNHENLGFIKAVNQGLAITDAPYVVLLNNDTTVAEQWLEKLRAGLDSLELAGLCGPLTDTPASWQGRWVRSNDSYFVMQPGRMLAFFCVMIRREVITQCGPLDESYGVGFGDDDAYCRLAESKGWRLVLAQGLKVHHAHRSTFKAVYSEGEILARQNAALEKFHLEGEDFKRKVMAHVPCTDRVTQNGDGSISYTPASYIEHLECGHEIIVTDTLFERSCAECVKEHVRLGKARFKRRMKNLQ